MAGRSPLAIRATPQSQGRLPAQNLYTVAVCGTREQLRTALRAMHLTGKIMTAYVERVSTLPHCRAVLGRWRMTPTPWDVPGMGKSLLSLLSFS